MRRSTVSAKGSGPVAPTIPVTHRLADWPTAGRSGSGRAHPETISATATTEQKAWRGRLQRAYERPTYEEAKRDLKAMRAELDELNQSAVASLDEGFEETLTLHRLGVFPLVGRSLKTTNVLESLNAQDEQRCGRVDRWRN